MSIAATLTTLFFHQLRFRLRRRLRLLYALPHNSRHAPPPATPLFFDRRGCGRFCLPCPSWCEKWFLFIYLYSHCAVAVAVALRGCTGSLQGRGQGPRGRQQQQQAYSLIGRGRQREEERGKRQAALDVNDLAAKRVLSPQTA